MRILLISPKMENPNGGIAVWTGAYLAWCEKHGADCHVVNTAAIGIRAEDGNAKRNFFDEFKRTKRIFKDLKGALAESPFDAAHLNSSCGSFGLIRDYLTAKTLKSKCPGLRLITHFHCNVPDQVGNFISVYFLKKLISVSDGVFVLCRSSGEYLKKVCKADTVLIPNFIGENQILKEKKAISESLSKLFFVGRVERAKGMRELFAAAAEFPKIRFELAGAVSEEMKREARPENVTLLGPISHERVSEEMDLADAFVFPSHTEGFSIALLESMARGLPCIATDVGANSDMLEGGCGIVIPPKDASSLTEAIRKILSSDQRREMSRNCIEKVKNCYTVDAVMKSIFDFYRNTERN